MGTILRQLLASYHYINVEKADVRTQNWFLMSSPIPIAVIIIAYLQFIYVLGPRWMANRKPFNLDRIMQIYNVVQIIASGYLVYKALKLGWLNDYKFSCEPVNYSMDPRPLEIARIVWVYFMVKIMDLLDTIFFVLRKKQAQVSFLHVYHHAGMIVGAWGGVKYLAGGHVTFLGLINSFVHMIMYTHYLLTSMKLGQPWWKKYITQLQLGQFILLLYHFAQLLWTPDCDFPRWPAAVFIPQNLFMLVLFGDFYYKTYVKKRPKVVQATNQSTTADQNTNAKSKSQ